MIPRAEHPNPQCERSEWINLNGEWEFEIDKSVSGKARRLFEQPHLSSHITVPFCPESKLSGVEDRDFLNCVWYRRDLILPDAWKNGRVLLHFGAVDRLATVYLNGKQVGTHLGGYVSFTVDITDALCEGVNSLCLYAEDDTRDDRYGHGKQSNQYHSYGCSYTRVTGIWQTVWLEHVPTAYIRNFRLYPDADNGTLTVEATVTGSGTLVAEASFRGKPMGSLSFQVANGTARGTMPLAESHLWEVGNGRLYDLKLSFGEDTVSSYFGLRSLRFDGYRFLLNGKSVYQRLVLDQGYYPDGLYTAPDEAALVHDIEISMNVGFNGARLHQKVFEPRFLYHCDKMGYLVWGEYGSWGINHTTLDCLPPLLSEWREIVERDFNHPSIVGWCPLNEVWPNTTIGKMNILDIHRAVYWLTKSLDSTRPCLDTSGGYHTEATDLFDIHDYTQAPAIFAQMFSITDPNEMMRVVTELHPRAGERTGPYTPGHALFVSEYGGIKWDINSGLDNAWGYGDAPKTEEEFINRYRGLTDVLLDNPHHFGFCYTQLYDIEQEVNGLYTYDRTPKFDDMSVFRQINSRKAKIED